MAISSTARHFCSAKILAGRAAMGDGGPHRRGGSLRRKEISRGNLLCAELGLPNLSYPSTIEHSKVRRHARFVTLSVSGSPGCQRGRAPLFGKEPRGNPFKGVPLGNFFLTVDAVLLCAAKKNGVGTTRLAGFFQFSPDPWVTHSSKKPHTVGSGK